MFTAQLSAKGIFEGCTNLETADINYHIPSTASIAYDFTGAFKNCKSLKSINLNLSVQNRTVAALCDGMFSGCLLGPEQLQQIANWNWIAPNYMKSGVITIGVDSTKVSQEDIDSYWDAAIRYKGFSINWELNTPE